MSVKIIVVPRGRVELPLSCENRILSPARLPVPPSGHSRTSQFCRTVSSMPAPDGQSATTLFCDGESIATGRSVATVIW